MPLRRSTRSARSTTLGIAAVAFAVLSTLGIVACSGDGSEGSEGSATTAAEATTTTADGVATTAGSTTEPGDPTTTAPEATTTMPPTTTTAASGGAAPTGDAETIDLFTDLRAEHCTEPTPEPIGTEPGEDDQHVVMVDNEGNRLIVDLTNDTVYGLDGPDGELPAAYSFGCDPEVFVGTID